MRVSMGLVFLLLLIVKIPRIFSEWAQLVFGRSLMILNRKMWLRLKLRNNIINYIRQLPISNVVL